MREVDKSNRTFLQHGTDIYNIHKKDVHLIRETFKMYKGVPICHRNKPLRRHPEAKQRCVKIRGEKLQSILYRCTQKQKTKS
jgi:hypothetical protein